LQVARVNQTTKPDDNMLIADVPSTRRIQSDPIFAQR